MAEYPIRVIQKACRVSNVANAERYFIYKAMPGDRVIACDIQKTTLAAASTNSRFTVGDGAEGSVVNEGFLVEADCDTEAGSAADFVDGTGEYLTSSGGKLYTTQTDIYARYVTGTTPGATAPEMLVRLWVAKS